MWVRVELGADECVCGDLQAAVDAAVAEAYRDGASAHERRARRAARPHQHARQHARVRRHRSRRAPGHRRDRPRHAQGRRERQREPRRDAAARAPDSRACSASCSRRSRPRRRARARRCSSASASARRSTRSAGSRRGRYCARSARLPADPRLAEFEAELLAAVNATGIGPGGPGRRHDRARRPRRHRALPHRRAAGRREHGLLGGSLGERGGGRVTEAPASAVEPAETATAAVPPDIAENGNGDGNGGGYRRLLTNSELPAAVVRAVRQRHRRLARHRFPDAARLQAVGRLLFRGRRHPHRQDHPRADPQLADRRARRPVRPPQGDDHRRPRARSCWRSRSSWANELWIDLRGRAAHGDRLAVLLARAQRAHPVPRRGAGHHLGQRAVLHDAAGQHARRALGGRPRSLRRSRRPCAGSSQRTCRSSRASSGVFRVALLGRARGRRARHLHVHLLGDHGRAHRRQRSTCREQRPTRHLAARQGRRRVVPLPARARRAARPAGRRSGLPSSAAPRSSRSASSTSPSRAATSSGGIPVLEGIPALKALVGVSADVRARVSWRSA